MTTSWPFVSKHIVQGTGSHLFSAKILKTPQLGFCLGQGVWATFFPSQPKVMKYKLDKKPREIPPKNYHIYLLLV